MNQQHIAWIDHLRGLSIIGVLIVHTCFSVGLSKLIYIGLIPSFFFISGFFAQRDNIPLIQFVKKKYHRLLLPYIVFNVISFIAWFFVTRHYGDNRNEDASICSLFYGMCIGTSHSLTYYVPLWFIPCLLFSQGVYYGICRVVHGTTKRVALVFLSCLLGLILVNFDIHLPFTIESALILVLFYCLGDIFSKQRKSPPIWLLSVMVVISLIAIIVSFLFNIEVHFHEGEVGNPLIMLLGATGWICISTMICKLSALTSFKLLSFMGTNTLIILCTHLLIYSAIKGIYVFVFSGDLNFFQGTLGSMFLILITIIIEMPTILIVNKYMPWIIGKQRKTYEKV